MQQYEVSITFLFLEVIPNCCDENCQIIMMGVTVFSYGLVSMLSLFFISFACPKETKQRKGHPMFFLTADCFVLWLIFRTRFAQTAENFNANASQSA